MRTQSKPLLRSRIAALVLLISLFGFAAMANASAWKWSTEKIDGQGTYPSVQIDSNGNLHLAYVANHTLLYGYRPNGGSRWFVMPVDTGLYATGIALDSKQRPNVCYELSDGQLRYASFDGLKWHPQPIAAGSGTIMFSCSVAVGTGDTPHVTWYQVARGGVDYYHLRHAQLSGGAWRASTVDTARETGKWHTSTILPDGSMAIAYSAFPDAQLKYARQEDGHWSIEVVDARPAGKLDNSHPIFGASVVVDKSGAPAISYTSETDIRFARRTNDKWNIETVDSILPVANRDYWWELRTSAAFDDQGVPHIVYQDAGALKHAYLDNEKWIVETLVATQGDTSRFAVMTASKKGQLYVIYRDPDTGALMMATGRRTEGQGPGPGTNAPAIPPQEKGTSVPAKKPSSPKPAAKKTSK